MEVLIIQHNKTNQSFSLYNKLISESFFKKKKGASFSLFDGQDINCGRKYAFNWAMDRCMTPNISVKMFFTQLDHTST